MTVIRVEGMTPNVFAKRRSVPTRGVDDWLGYRHEWVQSASVVRPTEDEALANADHSLLVSRRGEIDDENQRIRAELEQRELEREKRIAAQKEARERNKAKRDLEKMEREKRQQLEREQRKRQLIDRIVKMVISNDGNHNIGAIASAWRFYERQYGNLIVIHVKQSDSREFWIPRYLIKLHLQSLYGTLANIYLPDAA